VSSFSTSHEDSVRSLRHRELLGYGETPPHLEWDRGARLALQIVVNYEEGSELSYAMGDGENDGLHDLGATAAERDLMAESTYEYGARAGVWRLLRVFDRAAVSVTFFASAVAFERSPTLAMATVARGHEVAGHGFRWSNHWEMAREEEREAIVRAIDSLERTTGQRPKGWYSRRMSINTRELLVEIGGFTYDSDCYSDDLPYWTEVASKRHLVVPYSLVVNDSRYVAPPVYANPDDFVGYAQRSIDRLRREEDGRPRMMSIGLHPRLSGLPARADAIARVIEYAQSRGDVWIARRIDIANSFMHQSAESVTR
jgi:peptidoglycan/xylan/chitin deacetylase (PgdA/CDA1 family)